MDNEVAVPKPALKFLKREEGGDEGKEEARDDLDHLKPILTIAPRERTIEQIQILINYTKHIKFFAELAKTEGVEALQHCVQQISCETVKKGVFLFHCGDEGSKFYILLSGSVAILAPMRRKDGKADYSLLVVLRSGDSFGELALISHKPRAASVLVREDCSFAVLERGDYLRLLSRIQDNVLTLKVDILHRHPAFTSWNRNALQKLSYFFTVVQFKRKQVLFHAGQPATQVFLIKSGDFQLIKTIEVAIPRKGHHPAEVTLLSTGEMVGDQEVIAGGMYDYTCICASAQGEVMQIGKEDFLKRIVTDESAGCLKDVGRVKETYRSTRLRLISKLEREQWGTQRSNVTHIPKLWRGDTINRDSARSGLEAEVRKRWNLPHKQGSSLALEKAQSDMWIKSPILSPPGSPKPRPSFIITDFSGTAKRSPNPRSWIELVKLKYFHRRVRSGVLNEIRGSWDLSMTQWTVSSPKNSQALKEG